MELIKNLARSIKTRYVKTGLPLTDQLAAIRSMLANERTFLAYQRSALYLAATGLTFIRFFNSIWFDFFGAFFILSAGFSMAIGIVRYRRMRNLILGLETETIAENKNNDDKLNIKNGSGKN